MILRPILIADDEDEDVGLLLHSIRKARLKNKVICVPNGQAVFDYLGNKPPYADPKNFPLPSLIFLDLKMPEVDGFEVLDWLRQKNGFKDIPVVVLTGSMALEDISKAFQLGATAFLSKPCRIQDLLVLPGKATQWLQFAPVN